MTRWWRSRPAPAPAQRADVALEPEVRAGDARTVCITASLAGRAADLESRLATTVLQATHARAQLAGLTPDAAGVARAHEGSRRHSAAHELSCGPRAIALVTAFRVRRAAALAKAHLLAGRALPAALPVMAVAGFAALATAAEFTLRATQALARAAGDAMLALGTAMAFGGAVPELSGVAALLPLLAAFARPAALLVLEARMAEGSSALRAAFLNARVIGAVVAAPDSRPPRDAAPAAAELPLPATALLSAALLVVKARMAEGSTALRTAFLNARVIGAGCGSTRLVAAAGCSSRRSRTAWCYCSSVRRRSRHREPNTAR